MRFFQHPQALVESKTIGDDTRIWSCTHILSGARIGADCNICDHVFIENDVIVGDRVTIKCGVQLRDGMRIEDDVFIGPNVTFVNDNFPRSKEYRDRVLKTIVRKRASIGANATILAGLTIGQGAMVGAGAVVTKDVPPNAVVAGTPALIKRYVDSLEHAKVNDAESSVDQTRQNPGSRVSGVAIIDLPLIKDMRGSLSFAEYGRILPFIPKRYFIVFDVPSTDVRGEHAHRTLHQLLVCVKGSCSVVVDDGRYREEILLDRPTRGIHVPPLIWCIQYKYSPDAVLLGLASDVYNADDYIRDYDTFLEVVTNQNR